MPRDNRVSVTFRVAPQQRDWLDDIAAEHRVDRTVVIRAALATAKQRSADLEQMLAAMKDAG